MPRRPHKYMIRPDLRKAASTKAESTKPKAASVIRPNQLVTNVRTNVASSVSDSGEKSVIVPISDPTVINYIVLYLNNIFHDFGHLELVEYGESILFKFLR